MFKVSFMLLAAVAMHAQAAPPAVTTAKEAIEASIKAHGGKELMEKFQAGTMKAVGEMSLLGQTAKFDADITYCMPDKYRMNMTINVAGQKVKVDQVMKGDKMKLLLNGQAQAVDADTADTIKNDMAEQEMSRLTPLLDEKKFKIKLGDEGEVDGKKATVVVVNNVRNADKECKLFFDNTTHQLVKLQRKSKEPGTGNEVNEEIYYQDYKKVQDMMVMHKVVINHDGKLHAKFSMSEVKMIEKMDEKEFAVDD